MINKRFTSINGNHEIDITIIEEIAWFDIIKFKYEECKLFILLFKDVLTYMYENNIQYVKQYVNNSDVEMFKYSEYVINNDYSIITTPIDQFIDEICNVLNIKKLI